MVHDHDFSAAQNMAFSLIFSKNEYHHRILRKKWAILKKKSRSFRPFLTDFEVKIPKNTKKSTFLTKNFFCGAYKVDFFEILSNEFLIKTFFQGAQLCARNFSGVWDTLLARPSINLHEHQYLSSHMLKTGGKRLCLVKSYDRITFGLPTQASEYSQE